MPRLINKINRSKFISLGPWSSRQALLLQLRTQRNAWKLRRRAALQIHQQGFGQKGDHREESPEILVGIG